MTTREAALGALEQRFEQTLEELTALTRIPGISAPGFDRGELLRSAEAVAGLLEAAGLKRVEVLRIAEAHPYVVGEWTEAGSEAPTALLYAHHDVQPPGRLDRWKSPPSSQPRATTDVCTGGESSTTRRVCSCRPRRSERGWRGRAPSP
jgi:acetylornithine deacetylase/succinyl-diaminopimelate desuccinylase-like protein